MKGFLSNTGSTGRRAYLQERIDDPDTDVLERLFMIQEQLNIEAAGEAARRQPHGRRP